MSTPRVNLSTCCVNVGASMGGSYQSGASSSDVSGDGGSTGRVLTRGGRSSQNRLSDNIIPLFFGRPARAGRTLTVTGVVTNGRSNVGSELVDVSGTVEGLAAVV